MKDTFCPTCMSDRRVRVETRRERLSVRGSEMDVDSRVAVCVECGEDLWDDELADETLARAFDEYRREHHLLSPAEMTRIRGQWGLGQRAFSLLLGWGEITLHRYESGSVQDAAHDAQMRMADNPDNIRILLEANGDRLTPKQRASLERRLDEAHALEAEAECGDEALERMLVREATEPYGGDVPLSLAKAREAMVFFCQVPDMWVTKLAKLMFYMDFLCYKERTTSLTGLAYAHLPYGPVPEHYELLRADLLDNGAVRVEERCGADWSGEVLVAERQPQLAVFGSDEVVIMESVKSKLAGLSSIALSEMLHAETAYRSTVMGQRIPYATATDLSLSLE